MGYQNLNDDKCFVLLSNFFPFLEINLISSEEDEVIQIKEDETEVKGEDKLLENHKDDNVEKNTSEGDEKSAEKTDDNNKDENKEGEKEDGSRNIDLNRDVDKANQNDREDKEDENTKEGHDENHIGEKQKEEKQTEENKDNELPVKVETKKVDCRSDWWKQIIDMKDLDDINTSAKLILLFAILRECEMIEDKV